MRNEGGLVEGSGKAGERVEEFEKNRRESETGVRVRLNEKAR